MIEFKEPLFSTATDALFFDIDGTLLDIKPRPQDVMIPPDMIEKLKAIQNATNGAVAFISGRTIENIDELFAPLRLACAGVHGAMWRQAGDAPVETLDPLPEYFRKTMTETFKDDPMLLAEDKKYSLSIHYRRAPEKEEAVYTQATALLKQSGLDLELVNSRKTIEIRAKDFNKGSALRRFMAQTPFAGRRPIFVGDDVSDLPAIEAARAMGGMGFRVGGEEYVSDEFKNPAHVRAWIHNIIL